MTSPYDTCSFFRDSTLVHTEVPYKPFGFATTTTPFRLRDDGWSIVLLFLCLILAASLILRLRKSLGELLRGVFFPIPGKMDEPVVDDPLRYSTRLVAISLLAIAAAIVTFAHTQQGIGYYPFPETPYILFAAFLFLWYAYFLLKRLLTNFVNWVFFRSEKIFTWQRAYTFLYVSESIFFLILALTVTYLPIPSDKVLPMAFCFIFLVKIVLLFKTYQIFFRKMYGTLHLIVYFCTLELMPLLIIQQVLTYAECLSMVNL